MNNSINNVSFGAHLSISGNLSKHISREMANNFAQNTKKYPGTVTLNQMKLSKSSPSSLEMRYYEPKTWGLENVLEDIGESVDLEADKFYSAAPKDKLNILKNTFNYMMTLSKFNKIEEPTAEQRLNTLNLLKKLFDKIKIMNSDCHTADIEFVMYG